MQRRRARVRAVARLAPLGEPLELGPRDARQLRLRVEERPHRELRPHGDEVGRVQAAARESIDSTPRKASRTVGEAGQTRSWR